MECLRAGCWLLLEIGIRDETALTTVSGDPGFLVFTDAFFEKVGFAFHRNELHEVKRIGGVVKFGQFQGSQEVISHVFDVLAHQVGIHANKPNGQGICDKFFLDGDRIRDDLVNMGRIQSVVQMFGVEQGGKITVQPLVPANELVRKAKTGHESPLFEPENAAKGAREENSFHRRKGDEALGETALADPTQGPIRFLAHAVHMVNGVKEVVFLGGILDIGINEQGIGLGVDVLDHDLVPVEAPGFGILDFVQEIDGQILVDNPVTGREEGENMLDEMLFVGIKLVLPVSQVLGQVNFFGSPEAGLGFLVKGPDIAMLDREKDKAVFVLNENGFGHELKLGCLSQQNRTTGTGFLTTQKLRIFGRNYSQSA